MRPDEDKAFIALMMKVVELYGRKISEHLVELYWQILENFELVDLVQAFETHARNPDGGQFFPKPADIVRLIEGSGETRALSAWAKVERAIGQVGVYQSLVFDDCLIHAVLEDMGGWVKLCSSRLTEIPFLANEFQKRYMGFVLKPPARYPKYCCGIIESENSRNGYPIAARCLVGDIEKAQQVLLNGGGSPLCVQLIEVVEPLVRPLIESRSMAEQPIEEESKPA